VKKQKQVEPDVPNVLIQAKRPRTLKYNKVSFVDKIYFSFFFSLSLFLNGSYQFNTPPAPSNKPIRSRFSQTIRTPGGKKLNATLNAAIQNFWHQRQFDRVGQGKKPDLNLSIVPCLTTMFLRTYIWDPKMSKACRVPYIYFVIAILMCLFAFVFRVM